MPVKDDSSAENDWNGPFLLQLVVLGMLMADKQLRSLVRPEDFVDEEVRSAVKEMQAFGKNGWYSLRQILTACHLEWDGKSKPIDAMVKRLRLDATCRRALDEVNAAVEFIEGPGGWGDEAKAEFLRRVADIRRRARVDERLLPPVRPIDANRDNNGKIGKVRSE
jgi:hypothetical protein